MRVYIDATTLIALGTVGEVDLLRNFDGEIVVLPAVRDEVTTEPARTNVKRFVEKDGVKTEDSVSEELLSEAREVLGEKEDNGDVRIVAAVLRGGDGDETAVVSDDRRVRTVAEGFGATVTGTVGVVLRAVQETVSEEEAKNVVRRIDENGLHMTAELREKAYELIEKRANRRRS
jgi:predicted nucleic acid-binding protein